MHRALTRLRHSGTKLRYASDTDFGADHAYVLRIKMRSKLSLLERDLWGWICQVANRVPHLIKTVRYVIEACILHEFVR